MIYNVNYTDPLKSPIQISPGTLNTSTSLKLPGKNFTRYGEIIAENFLNLMENFAYDTPPENPVKGQFWYDTSNDSVKVYDGTDWFEITATIDDIANVYYVAENGNDNNTGRNIGDPFRTIEKALQTIRDIDTAGEVERIYTTVFVKSGTYTINNPQIIPENTAIVGDSLRTVTIRPQNPYLDIFWVNNAVYITQVTFRDHKKDPTNQTEGYNGPAAVAFPPDGSAGIITTSPYVQNCSSITTTGTGMRVDGNHAQGLRSMVLDAYTQYNQGGIGVHMLNRGNTQLVSLFTICCDKSVWCETGGFCSLTNSNSSFGNFALYTDGVSDSLYNAKFVSRDGINVFTIDNLSKKPNVGDAIKFASNPNYLTIQDALDLTIAGNEVIQPDVDGQSQDLKDARNLILENKSIVQSETINFILTEYPDLQFDLFKCSRDVELILDAVADDIVFGTNFLSIAAGLSYYKNAADTVIDLQLTETVAALNFVKTYVLSLFTSGTTEYTRIEQVFDTIINILQNGETVAPDPTYTNPTVSSTSRENAKSALITNRNTLIDDAITYRDTNYPAIAYDEEEFRENLEYIINAVIYDILYLGNSKTTDAADEFFKNGLFELETAEKTAVTDTMNNLLSDINALGGVDATQQTRMTELFGLITTLIDEGYTCQIFTDEQGVTLEQLNELTGFVEFIDIEYSVGETATFHQYSLITASGHTFEWVGAGTDINTALPYLGGVAVLENQIIEENGGRVYFTGTDQRGDFRIGTELTINRARGTIEGRVFRRSLYQIMTPYILALQE